MALLLTSVFGVTGCGSDENTQLETEITQLETEITQLETEITQFEARVDALEEQAKSRVTNLTLDPNSTISSSENDELRSLENEFDDQTDDAVQFQSRSKNAAPEASGVSDAPSYDDCDRLIPFLELGEVLTLLDRPDLLDRGSLLDRRVIDDLLAFIDDLDLDRGYLDRVYDKLLDDLELIDDLDLRRNLPVIDQCAAALMIGDFGD